MNDASPAGGDCRDSVFAEAASPIGATEGHCSGLGLVSLNTLSGLHSPNIYCFLQRGL